MSVEAQFVYRRPKWGRGMITDQDARFLHDLIVEMRPHVAIEVGVASGCSSVAILEAMATYRTDALMGDVWLHAYDIAERCYFNESKRTGAAVAELTPWHASRYRFTVGDVVIARQQLAGLEAPFAFIDGNHLHPWASADLLGLLPMMAPAAWIAVHDIRLPLLERRRGARGHGPRHLFDTWPGEKRQGGSDDNIGAIRLPDDPCQAAQWLERSFRRPWEVALPASTTSALRIKVRPVKVVPKNEALRELAKAAARQRPLYVCGAGQAARALASELQRRDLPVTAFADRQPRPQGLTIDGLPVEPREQLSRSRRPKPFMAVSGVFAIEIDAELASEGWVRGEDYVVF
jgi:hypothetical protein